jgi:hypothetical protein
MVAAEEVDRHIRLKMTRETQRAFRVKAVLNEISIAE